MARAVDPARASIDRPCVIDSPARFKHLAAQHMDINPTRRSLEDLVERSHALRGYL